MSDEERKNILRKMGFRSNLLGFKYIFYAWIIIERSGGKVGMTTQLYPKIANEYNTTPSRVERAIRHAIERLYKDNENIQRYYKKVPTNSLFLYDLYEFRGKNIK